MRRCLPAGVRAWGLATALLVAAGACGGGAEPDPPADVAPGAPDGRAGAPGGSPGGTAGEPDGAAAAGGPRGAGPDARAAARDGGAGEVDGGARPADAADASADTRPADTRPRGDATDARPAAAPLLRFGLHPDASDALRAAGVMASQITQTIGDAAASAGTHAQDGTVAGQPYSAATDISVRGLSEAQIRDLLRRLHAVGFAAWYRKPGYDGWPASEAPHIHAVYAGCAMKRSLRDQIRDFLVGRNGLRSHAIYDFYRTEPEHIELVRRLFLMHNPATG